MASGVPEQHKHFKPEENTVTEWNDKWTKLQTSKELLIIIMGNRGAGKTQMAICKIREECKIGGSCLYSKAFDIFLDIRSTYKKDSKDSEIDIVKKYCIPKLLVIDAIENRSETQFENQLLSHIIDRRYDDIKQTIMISNQDEKAFAISMGPSIVDRIHESGLKLICNWKSFRRNQ
jgi:DNA replication protein DnaC